jgi:protein-tyrosine-phosphatase
MKIHFICNGNAYRSRMAEAYLKSLHTGLDVISSGVIANANREYNDPMVIDFTDDFLYRHDIRVDLPPHPIQLTQDRLLEGDMTIIMNGVVRKNIEHAGFKLPTTVVMWHITDQDEQDDANEEVLGLEDHTERIFIQMKKLIDETVSVLQAQKMQP